MGQKRFEAWILPAEDFVLLTAAALTAGADIDCPENTRGLLVGTAGAQDVTMRNGNTRDLLPLIQGINPGFFATIRVDASNTAANIWAII